MLVMEKPLQPKPKKSLTLKPKQVIKQYPQADLVEVLDKKLSALQDASTFEGESHPKKYIWGPDDDAPLEVFRNPGVARTQDGWGAAVNRRVVSENWAAGRN